MSHTVKIDKSKDVTCGDIGRSFSLINGSWIETLTEKIKDYFQSCFVQNIFTVTYFTLLFWDGFSDDMMACRYRILWQTRRIGKIE